MDDPTLPVTPATVRHGGDLVSARARFPDAPQPWLDLSTGINPVPYPLGAIPSEAWSRLPDGEALAMVEAAAAAAYGAASSTTVVAGPGTQAIIQLLPRLIAPRRVAVLGFGYQEHPHAWARAGAEVAIVDSLDACAGADLAVVVNPNNPDGRIVDADDLLALARRLAERGGTLVVDEAFADVAAAGLTLVPRLPRNAIVLRSFGKVFGLAGLRLGFALAEPTRAAAIRAGLGPWAVSGPALAIASRALPDIAWREITHARLTADAARLDHLLKRAGLSVLGGTALFRLASTDQAACWFDRLGRAGFLVRSFDARPTWLRFGLPGDAAAWARLDAALR